MTGSPGRKGPSEHRWEGLQETLPSIPERHLRDFFRPKEARLCRNTWCISKSRNEFGAEKGRKGPKGHGWEGLHMNVGARDYSRAPALFTYIPMLPLLPPSVGETDAALGTTASQNLAAVGSGHALTETMDLGAMTLLGLIGTNHAETPPVQIGKARSPWGLCRPPQHPDWDAVGKINALNSAHEIIPKSAPSVKKNSNLFSHKLGGTRCCGGIFSF